MTGCDQLGRSPLPGILNEPRTFNPSGDALANAIVPLAHRIYRWPSATATLAEFWPGPRSFQRISPVIKLAQNGMP